MHAIRRIQGQGSAVAVAYICAKLTLFSNMSFYSACPACDDYLKQEALVPGLVVSIGTFSLPGAGYSTIGKMQRQPLSELVFQK